MTAVGGQYCRLHAIRRQQTATIIRHFFGYLSIDAYIYLFF